MNLDNVTRAGRRHAGLLVGGVLGLLSGLHVFGLAIGTLLGYLVDEIFHSRRILKFGGELIANGVVDYLDDTWVDRTISAALAALAAPAAQENNGIGLARNELLKSRIVGLLDVDGREAGLTRQLVEYTLAMEEVDSGKLAEIYRDRFAKERRVDLVRLMLNVSGGTNPFIKEVSLTLEMPAAVFSKLQSEHSPQNLEAYETLGVGPESDDQEIKAVYRRLAAQFHPDTGRDLAEHQREQSREAFLRIQNAYNTIMEHRRESGD